MTKKDIILHKVFWGEFNPYFTKTLWRMSEGSRSEAFKIIRATAVNFTSETYTDRELDLILGELNNGIDIEWKSA